MATAILAAGVILVRHDAGVDKIALVNRAEASGEVGLPEGEMNRREEIFDAAKRVIQEQAFCEGQNPTFAGTICYFADDSHKVVFVCQMELAREGSAGPQNRQQAPAVQWMRPAEAVQKLKHQEARRLITEIFDLLPTDVQAADSVWSKAVRTWWGIFGSEERDRLADKIAETRIDLDRQVQSSSQTASPPDAGAAYQYLSQAKRCLRCCNLQRGWVNVLSARRTALAIFKDINEANRVADVLRHESEKVTGWRSKAIAELMPDKDKKFQSSASDDEILRLVAAVSLLDDYSNNSYFKIVLRRRHLFTLFVLLILAVLGSLFVWPLPACLHKFPGRFLIVLCGVLGAGVSVAQNLLSTDISAKIPAQQIGAFLVWMRPAIGAAAALFAVALVKAGSSLKFFDDKIEHNVGAILVIAVAAGFSERFITQAIEKISDQSDKR